LGLVLKWLQNNKSVAILAFVLVATHFYFLNIFQTNINTNGRTRIYAAMSLVRNGNWEISPWLEKNGGTLDRAVIDGKHYSDKPPGSALLLAPFIWIADMVGIPSDDKQLAGLTLFLRICTMSIPAILFWIFTLPYWRRLSGSDELGSALMLAGALGTNFFIYATQIFSHSIAGILGFGSFLLLFGLADRDGGEDAGQGLARDVGAGALIGFGVVCDYLLAFLPVVFAGFLLLRAGEGRVKRTAAFVGGGAPFLIGLLAYNQACFGSPLSSGFLHHASELYGPAYRDATMGMRAPSLSAMWGLLFSRIRGLFFYSPFLLLAFHGWYRAFRAKNYSKLIPAFAFFAVLLFASTTIQWQGGMSVSSRYMTPIIPFLMHGVALSLAGKSRIFLQRVLFAGLVLVSLFMIQVSAATFPKFYRQLSDPIWQLAVPLLRGGVFNANIFGGKSVLGMLLPYLLLLWGCASGIIGIASREVKTRSNQFRIAVIALALSCLVVMRVSAPVEVSEKGRWAHEASVMDAQHAGWPTED
jgi:hypothetical protein